MDKDPTAQEHTLNVPQMDHLRRTKIIVGTVVVLAIVIRVAVGIATRSWEFSPDENHWDFGYEMGRIAGSLVAGSGFAYPTVPPQPTAWMPPAYPMFMAAVFSVFGPYTPQSALVIESLQVIASALSCVLLFLLGNRLYGPTVGQVSAFLLAIYPPAVHYSVQKIWSSTFFAMILLWALFLFTSQARRPTHAGMVFLGIILGIGALFNPLILSVIPPMTAWLYCEWKRQRQRHPAALLLLFAACILILTPWFMRNYAVFGRFVLIKSNLGHEILVGSYEPGVGEWSGVEREIRGFQQPIKGLIMTDEELEIIRHLNEIEKNHFYLSKGIEIIANNPARFFRQTGMRFARFWTSVRTPKNVKEVVHQSPYFVISCLGLFGIYLTIRDGLPRGVLVIPLLFFPVPYYVTVVGLHRYRFPLEPILLVFAALAVAALVPRLGLTARLHSAG